MNVEIGAEAALFPEKEYINGIAVAVWAQISLRRMRSQRTNCRQQIKKRQSERVFKQDTVMAKTFAWLSQFCQLAAQADSERSKTKREAGQMDKPDEVAGQEREIEAN